MAENNFTAKQGIGCALAAVGFFITMPIWYWLFYQILIRVNATPTMWVFYWIYAPVGFIAGLLRSVLLDGLFADKK